MTLPRKGSRTIEVDGAVYRWKPSPMRGYEPPMMSLVAHEDTKPANSTLDVAFWESHCSILTPEVVALIIRGALGAGWKPKSRGTFKVGPDQASEWFFL